MIKVLRLSPRISPRRSATLFPANMISSNAMIMSFSDVFASGESGAFDLTTLLRWSLHLSTEFACMKGVRLQDASLSRTSRCLSGWETEMLSICEVDNRAKTNSSEKTTANFTTLVMVSSLAAFYHQLIKVWPIQPAPTTTTKSKFGMLCARVCLHRAKPIWKVKKKG